MGEAYDAHANEYGVLWTPAPNQPGAWVLNVLGKNLVPTALNDAGQVVGYEVLPDGGTAAFLWQSGQVTVLNGEESRATGINNHGQVVGYVFVRDSQTGADVNHAFLWENGQAIDLARSTPGGNSQATAINDAGQIVGFADVPIPNDITYVLTPNAFLWTPNPNGGQMQDLGTLGGYSSEALAINQAGEVTGYADTASGVSHAFIIQNGQMVDLNTLTGSNSPFTASGLGTATAIAPAANVIGGSAPTNTGNQTHGYVATPVLTVGGATDSSTVFDIDLADLLPHLDDTIPGIPPQQSSFSAIQQALLNLNVLSSTLPQGSVLQVYELAEKGTGNLSTDLSQGTGGGTITNPNGGLDGDGQGGACSTSRRMATC